MAHLSNQSACSSHT